MKKHIALLVTICLFSASLLAQDEMSAPSPPAELKRFDRLIGTWAGTGTAAMAPGMEASGWTSRSQVKKAMGGFFLEENTVIDVGEGMPAPLVFRSFMGYDSTNRKYLTVAVGNMGGASTSEMHWVDDNTMVSVESGMEDGVFAVDRWVTTLGTDTYSFVGHRSVDGGEFFVYVQGEMKRIDEPFEAPSSQTTPAFGPAGAQMQRLNRMAGRYRLAGKMQMMPDAPSMDISGVETLAPIFGGTALQATVVGDPVPGLGAYEAWAVFTWNDERRCYTTLFVNNMGEIGESEMRWVGDQLVTTSAQLRMDLPSVYRGVITLDEKGAITKMASHSMIGAHAPGLDFEATYSLQR